MSLKPGARTLASELWAGKHELRLLRRAYGQVKRMTVRSWQAWILLSGRLTVMNGLVCPGPAQISRWSWRSLLVRLSRSWMWCWTTAASIQSSALPPRSERSLPIPRRRCGRGILLRIGVGESGRALPSADNFCETAIPLRSWMSSLTGWMVSVHWWFELPRSRFASPAFSTTLRLPLSSSRFANVPRTISFRSLPRIGKATAFVRCVGRSVIVGGIGSVDSSGHSGECRYHADHGETEPTKAQGGTPTGSRRHGGDFSAGRLSPAGTTRRGPTPCHVDADR